jgi:hypothetical protein
VPLHLAIDPRLKDAEAGMRKAFELSVRVNERFSQLHQAINEIHETKSQLDALRQRSAGNDKLQSALAAADQMEKKMAAIEEKLIQVKMKSSEGNLVYPNQLNEEFYTFSKTIEVDAAPTQPQEDVFQMLNGRLEEQLKGWAQVKQEDVPRINQLIKQADLPALTVALETPRSPGLPASASPSPSPNPSATSPPP